MSELHPTAARGFDSAAGIYERSRPSYPGAAVDFMVDTMRLRRARTVVDLAAGTGKFTRELIARGITPVAVEPVEGMRAEFTRVLPGVQILDGTAEHLPFDDAAADAITVAQAFHWFATDIALAEIGRVLRPSGALGLVWNARDDRTDWVARITEVFARYETGPVRVPRHRERAWRTVPRLQADFEPVAEREFPYIQLLTPEGLLERFASVSFVAVLDEDEKRKAIDEVRALIAMHPDLRGRETIEHPYVTEVYLFRRR